ncbi:hypothetical protein BTO09_10505 [Gilvibacter sp. SZ-19]|uniref:hypothetical protein n=1 Tax=Gilvibacter sp. SZ-19 TaxID=754429 RepID=UPI000B3C0131|nr:hypothetical protein [Gilvibacter sp. SZ-19]ARV12750.1 hypothetical protein BTO09_10505 [Gilvibacter sp. SZ-19]
MYYIQDKSIADEVLDLNYRYFFSLIKDTVYVAVVAKNDDPKSNLWGIEVGFKKGRGIGVGLIPFDWDQKGKSPNKGNLVDSIVNDIFDRLKDRENPDKGINFREVDHFKLHCFLSDDDQARITHNVIRPAASGCAIGPGNIYKMGTLGAVVQLKFRVHNNNQDASTRHSQEAFNKQYFIMSNYHVLVKNYRKLGKSNLIHQPKDQYQKRTTFKNVLGEVEYGKFNNFVDVAFARVHNPDEVVFGNIWNSQKINGHRSPIIGEEVYFHGKTTYHRSGSIRSDNAYVNHKNPYSGEPMSLQKQILTTAVSEDGDSGSLLIAKEDNAAVGLIIGGDDKHFSIANSMKTIFSPNTYFESQRRHDRISFELFNI